MKNIEELLGQTKLGCKKAERGLYDLLQSQLDSFLFHLVRNEIHREEVIHCTLIKVFLHLQEFDDSLGIKFKTWVFRIGKNTALTHLRLNKKFLAHTVLETCPPASFSYDEKLDLEKALNLLPEKYLTPVLLRYREDLSYEEIAEVLGIKLNTLRSLLLRAHRRLRKSLDSC